MPPASTSAAERVLAMAAAAAGSLRKALASGVKKGLPSVLLAGSQGMAPPLMLATSTV